MSALCPSMLWRTEHVYSLHLNSNIAAHNNNGQLVTPPPQKKTTHASPTFILVDNIARPSKIFTWTTDNKLSPQSLPLSCWTFLKQTFYIITSQLRSALQLINNNHVFWTQQINRSSRKMFWFDHYNRGSGALNEKDESKKSKLKFFISAKVCIVIPITWVQTYKFLNVILFFRGFFTFS